MVIKINNKETKITEEIRAIFQVSYAFEAEILKTLDIERLCKRYFGRKGYLTLQEFPDIFLIRF